MRTLYHPSRDDLRLATVLHALSDPVRLKIVNNLAKNVEQTCSDFKINVAKSTLSHHFKVLRQAGITQVRTEGKQCFVSLRHDDLDARFPGLLQSILQVPEPF